MLSRLFFCVLVIQLLGCKSGRELSAAEKFAAAKSNPRKSGANVWLLTDRRSDRYVPKSKRGYSGKVVENVTVEQWDCPNPETVRYMPKATKMKIRRNMRRINDELDGTPGSTGRPVSQIVFKKGKSKNK